MSDKLKKLQIKKLIQEYNYIQSDFEYKNQLIEENKEEFIKEATELENKLGIKREIPNFVDHKKNIENKIIDIPENIKNKIKKIYREIAKLTHPDKVDTNNFFDLYHKATKCSHENDLLCLYLISLELNIDFEFDSEDINFLQNIIESKRKENSLIESSCFWIWINCDNEETRKELIKFYVINSK